MAKQKDSLVNIQAAQLAGQVANWAAQLEFQKQRFSLLELPQFQNMSQLEVDKFAWQKAQDTWERAYQEAEQTGKYNGQDTIQWLTEQAKMTGVLNGQQTLEGKLSDAQIAQMNASMLNTQKLTDLEYDKFGFEREKYPQEFQLKKDQQEAALTGYLNGLPTFERQQWEASQGQAMMQLISSLRGPENAFAQLKVLQGMPDGLRAMTEKWAGIKQGTSYGTATGAPVAATVQNQLNAGMQYTPQGYLAPQPQVQAQAFAMPALVGVTNPQGVLTGAVQGLDPASQAAVMGGTLAPGVGTNTSSVPITPTIPGIPPYTYDPPGSQAHPGAYNYQSTSTGSTQVYPPGTVAPSQGAQISTYVPMSATQQASTGQQIGTGGQATPALGSGLMPTQINAKEYNKSTGYEKALGWAGFENAGWDKGVAQELYQKSLPKYGVKTNTQGTVTL